MAFPHRVVKVTFSGTMYSGSEIWSTGIHLGWENQDATEIIPQGLADVGTAFATLFSTPAMLISDRYTFDMVKMTVLNNDGKTMPDTSQYWAPPAVVKGGKGLSHLPPQCSLVVSLGNTLPRGLAAKGRMFMPGIAQEPDVTGHIPQTQVDGVANAMKIFFDSIYNDADLPGQPVLVSLGRGPLNMDGAIKYISKVRIGNVIDTQRRRRNAIGETYTERAVAQV